MKHTSHSHLPIQILIILFTVFIMLVFINRISLTSAFSAQEGKFVIPEGMHAISPPIHKLNYYIK